MSCGARRYGDQMICSQCGLAWDYDDPEPPTCPPKPSPTDPLTTDQFQQLKDILTEGKDDGRTKSSINRQST